MLTPRFLALEEILWLHEDQIESFGGTSGIRDMGLLESALAQPKASFGGEFLHPTLAEQAAAYLYHLAMNHPFVDGNKRTAFAAMESFVVANGYSLELSNEEAYELVLNMVEGAGSKADLASKLALVIRKVKDD